MMWSLDNQNPMIKATTILTVKKNGKIVMIGDGQVSMGSTIVKPNAKKVRRLSGGNILAGFAGTTADAYTLIELLEAKLEEHPGQLLRSCVELAKAWRSDKFLRKLAATMCVADRDILLTVTGTGDILEPNDGLIGIGSGGMYALSCARGLIDIPEMDALTIAKKSMEIAANICVYTNTNFVIESLDCSPSEVAPQSTASSTPT